MEPPPDEPPELPTPLSLPPFSPPPLSVTIANDKGMLVSSFSFKVALLALDTVEPVYAFTRREVEEITVGGGLQKTSVFRHVGFVRPYEAHFDVL